MAASQGSPSALRLQGESWLSVRAVLSRGCWPAQTVQSAGGQREGAPRGAITPHVLPLGGTRPVPVTQGEEPKPLGRLCQALI